MRVLIIVENLPVPFDRRVWQEAQTLHANGCEVFVICPKGTTAHTEAYEVLNGIHIYRHPLPHEASGALGFLLEYATAIFWERKLARAIYRKHGFDVIHICNPPDLIYLVAKRYKRKHGVKIIFDHHDINPELYIAKFGREDFFYRLLLAAEAKTFALADHCIATNESYREIAITRGRRSPADVTVIRSGPSLERLYDVPPDDSLRGGKKHLITYLGVIGRQEGIRYLVEASRIMKFEMGRSDFRVLVMGSGPDLQNAIEAARERDVDDVVTFAGRVSDEYLRTALSTADVCVNPDEYNEMNDKSTMNKVMEYMAMGKPIVQFDLTEGRYSAQEASLYARPNDARDFAEKIVGLLDDPAQRRSMGDFGKKRVQRDLNWVHEAPKLVEVYERLGLASVSRGRH